MSVTDALRDAADELCLGGPGIHSASVVHADCKIGPRSKVWQFASVIRGSVIGDDCVIGAGACVDGCRLGNRVHVGSSAFLHPGLLIGDDVFIGPHATFCNDTWPRVDKLGWFDIEELTGGRVVVTEVRSGASIGAGAIVMPGVSIGSRAMIAAGAIVDRDVLPGMLFKRSGDIVPINYSALPNRMRSVVS